MNEQRWSIVAGGIYILTTPTCLDPLKKLFGVGFLHKTGAALNTINTGPVGKQLIAGLVARCAGHTRVVIREVRKVTEMGFGRLPGDGGFDRLRVAWFDYTPAYVEGAAKQVADIRDREPLLSETRETATRYYNEVAALAHVPSFVALAHELIHALHWLDGTYVSNEGDEEARTVGLGAHSHEPVCENAIRREHKLPIRTTYSGQPLGAAAVPAR
ncbi:MAG: hypothetical protein JWO38_3370 [Gemmataceae bacterium]|nr:hypothetical protein [Gemmataceae bacterium]